MINVTNKQIINSTNSLQVLINKDIDIVMSYKISVTVKKIDELLELYNKSFKKLQSKYTQKDKKGNPITYIDEKTKQEKYKIKDEDNIKLNDEINELQNVENSISDVNPIDIKELEGINIPTSVIMNLDYLFTMDK
jgi:DNA-binding transcriptional MerR regulator